jgi:alpha-tubulin suppressor-like RCC1 family protein
MRAARIVVGLVSFAIQVGCGGGGDQGPRPPSVSYPTNPAIYTSGVVIDSNTPSNMGGAAASYSVSPSLPVGLSLDTATGVISGTPSAITARATYTVTATNSAGSSKVDLVVAVMANSVEGTDDVIAAGGSHTCVVVNGSAQCWGANVSGQLGNGSTIPVSYTQVQVHGLTSGVQAIAAGGDTTCAIVNGGVQCWGRNDAGQLGNGSTTDSSVPVQVQGLTSGVQAIAVGGRFACAIVNGGAWCWGDNGFSQLGNSGIGNGSAVPVPVQFLSSGVQAIAAGSMHACAIASGGVRCWGYNIYGEVGDNTRTRRYSPVQVVGLTSGVQAIAAGSDYTCALVNGGVQCWGRNVYGELGNGSTDGYVMVPVPVQGLSSGVQRLSASVSSSCVIVNGGVQCWGYNQYGQLGDGSSPPVPPSLSFSRVPVPVQGLTSGVQALSRGGTYHICALANGAVECWGRNISGQLGNISTANSRVPVQVWGMTTGRQAVQAGFQHACALVAGGARCWGANGSGQLGDGSGADSDVPLDVQGLSSGVQAIATGGGHTCAIVNGGARCWGLNDSGQLGRGSIGAIVNSGVPFDVQGLSTGVQAITAGMSHTCALANGGVRCWGKNTKWKPGDPTIGDSPVPFDVTGLSSGVQAIAGSDDHTCALVNGGVRCWGTGSWGQLGDGTATGYLIPVQVQGLSSGVQAIAGGGSHTCALVSGGVQCWGYNGSGQLGDGSTNNGLVPVQVLGLSSGVQGIGAGTRHTCAIVGGDLQCWGSNVYGQVGDGSTSDRQVPVRVQGLTGGVQGLTAGGRTTCALEDGAARCWGWNSNGQLGNGLTGDSSVPVQVTGLSPFP